MRIAMIGQRGLPATHGGIERHVEELGARLTARGHEVVVFCRPGYTPDGLSEYRGMRLVRSWTPATMHLEAFVHSGASSLSVLGRGFDVVHYHALGPGLFSPVPRIASRAAVVQTIHGLDDQRAKWGTSARRVLSFGGWLSARVPHELVVVSRSLRTHYLQQTGRSATYIPNGAPAVVPRPPGPLLQQYGLRGGDYALSIGRLVPEKDVICLVKAFREVKTDSALIIVGGTSFTDGYVAEVAELAAEDPRVVMAGFRYGDELAELLSNASVFVQPSLLEGLPITLLEAAAYGRPVIVSDIEPHLEVIGVPAPGRDAFPAGNVDALTKALQLAFDDNPAWSEGGSSLRRDVTEAYDWDRATDELEAVYRRASGLAGPPLPATTTTIDLRTVSRTGLLPH